MSLATKLHLYEEITLLALRDDKGTMAISFAEQAIAGAMTAELVALGHLSISDDKKRFVDLANAEPTGDPLLDECIDRVAKAKRRARLQTWVSRFASIKRLPHKAAEQLCSRGILNSVESKVLLLFNRTVYPEVDHRPEAQIIGRLERAIFSDSTELDWKDALLVSLSDSFDLLPKLFDKKRLKTRKARIKQISEGELIGKATRDLLIATRTALLVATTVVPVVAASS